MIKIEENTITNITDRLVTISIGFNEKCLKCNAIILKCNKCPFCEHIELNKKIKE